MVKKPITATAFWEDHVNRMDDCFCDPDAERFGCLLGDAEYYADPATIEDGYIGLFSSARAIVKRLREAGIKPEYASDQNH